MTALVGYPLLHTLAHLPPLHLPVDVHQGPFAVPAFLVAHSDAAGLRDAAAYFSMAVTAAGRTNNNLSASTPSYDFPPPLRSVRVIGEYVPLQEYGLMVVLQPNATFALGDIVQGGSAAVNWAAGSNSSSDTSSPLFGGCIPLPVGLDISGMPWGRPTLQLGTALHRLSSLPEDSRHCLMKVMDQGYLRLHHLHLDLSGSGQGGAGATSVNAPGVMSWRLGQLGRLVASQSRQVSMHIWPACTRHT
jgi:hypothetical protein